MGDKSHVIVADATNWTISGLESSYSGSKEQIATLREMGVDKKVLDNLEENLGVMRTEIDRERTEYRDAIRKQAWKSLEENGKKLKERTDRELLASQVVEESSSCNLLSRRILSGDFFNLNAEIVNSIHKECSDADGFRIKIGALAQMFEIDLSPLKSKVRGAHADWKSVKLLEEWITQNSLRHDSHMFEVWRNIIDLRNASFPYHPTDDRVMKLIAFFGHSYPPDYSALWMDILTQFLVSIVSFRKILELKA